MLEGLRCPGADVDGVSPSPRADVALPEASSSPSPRASRAHPHCISPRTRCARGTRTVLGLSSCARGNAERRTLQLARRMLSVASMSSVARHVSSATCRVRHVACCAACATCRGICRPHRSKRSSTASGVSPGSTGEPISVCVLPATQPSPSARPPRHTAVPIIRRSTHAPLSAPGLGSPRPHLRRD